MAEALSACIGVEVEPGDMWISREDLKRINEVFEQFPDSGFFTLEQDNHAGIGSVTRMTVPHTIAGQEGEFTVEISGTEDW